MYATSLKTQTKMKKEQELSNNNQIKIWYEVLVVWKEVYMYFCIKELYMYSCIKEVYMYPCIKIVSRIFAIV